MTGPRRSKHALTSDQPHDRFEYVEATYPDDEVVTASVESAGRRGTSHRADRNEVALRLIGRHVNERGGARVLVVDQGDGFLVRMLLESDTDMPHRFESITSAQLGRMREVAVGARQERPTTRS